MQTGYRILVSTDPGDLETGENLIWDSGDVPSDRSVLTVPYEGPELESRRDYYWKVRVATNHGDTLWSEPSRWSMALLDDSDWQARWIGYDSCLNRTDTLGVFSRLAARYLRKEFDAGRDIAQARLYISGLGLYECPLNGCRVGEDVLAPTATDYTKTVCYNVYDVTDLLDEGVNTIGVILGNGRFFSMRTVTYTIPFTQVTIPGVRNYGYPKLLAQLEITDSEGNRTVVASDESWKLTTDGPIVADNEYDGETYDARLEMPGWSRNGYDDSSWRDARSVAAPEGRLTAQANPNIRVMDTVEPVSIAALNDSTWIVDMGQNMVGWLAVELEGRKDRPVRLRFAETLQDDGNLYVDNLRGAKATDLYTPAEERNFLVDAAFHLSRFPLRRDCRSRREARLGEAERRSHLRRDAHDGTFRDVRLDDQSGVPERLLGPERQLPQHADDRLSAARRAHGLARRPRDGVHRRELHVPSGAALREMGSRHSRLASFPTE